MSRRNGTGKHATLYDFRDLDLLLKIEDEGDNDGWVETEHLAGSLGFGDELRPVGIRLGWMRRFGMLEHDERDRRWRLTDGAGRVIDARLRAAQARSIENLPDESMIEVMAAVTTRYHLGSPMLATMLRREFLFGTKPR